MAAEPKIEARDGHLLISSSDEAYRAFAPIVAAARALPAYAGTLDIGRLRAGGIAFAEGPLAMPVPAGVEEEKLDVGGLPASRFVAAAADRDRPSLLYFHGGGYVAGSVAASRGIAGSISAAARAPVIAVGYRQAPEHVFPAAGDDALKAYDWLSARIDQPIAAIGDSAGGSLAVALALAVARSGRRPLRAVVACSAWFDLRMRGASWIGNADRDLVSQDLGRFFRDLYLGGTDPGQADAALWNDLALLPPLLIQMGEAEGARDDALAYAAAARAAGADVTVELYRDMPHNFVKFANPIAGLAIERLGRWLDA